MKYQLHVSDHSEDMGDDDNFIHHRTVVVRDESGAMVYSRSFVEHYNANDQSRVGERPDRAVLDGDELVLTFSDREERVKLRA